MKNSLSSHFMASGHMIQTDQHPSQKDFSFYPAFFTNPLCCGLQQSQAAGFGYIILFWVTNFVL